MYLAVLGSHPDISLAELEVLQNNVKRFSNATATFDDKPSVHMGGSSKIAKIVDELPFTGNKAIEHFTQNVSSYLEPSSTKQTIGISIYGHRTTTYKKLCLQVKNELKNQGYKVRMVIGSNQTLNTAQVLHNRLLDNHGEFVIANGQGSTLIARTVWLQDIDSYTNRDINRPCRNMKVGMLPPKLAQIMVNLSQGENIFDPFCGTGVILQEALLMGKKTSGSDIDPKMVQCTKHNLAWLKDNYNTQDTYEVSKADAKNVQLPQDVDAVVSEGYLGPPINTSPSAQTLKQLAEESDHLLTEVLSNLSSQLNKGLRVCICAPVWKQGAQTVAPRLVSLATGPQGSVDAFTSLGYNLVRLKSVSPKDLLYLRKDQYVGRQLILLEKI